MHRLNNNNNKWKYNCTDWNYGLKFDNWWSIVFKNVILLFAIFISIKIYPLLQGNFINYLKYLFQIEVEEWICCLYYRTSECLGFVHVSWTGWLLAPSCYKALVMPRHHEIARFSHNFKFSLNFLTCVLKDPILASVVAMSWLPCAPLGWLSLSCHHSSREPLRGCSLCFKKNYMFFILFF